MRRLPVYLLLDTSGSMYGEPIEAVCHFCNAAYTFEPEEIMTEYVKKIEK